MKKLLFLAALFTATVMNLNAETVTNVKYIDANGNEQTCAQATVVESSDEQVTWEDGWYVVTGTDVTLSSGAACKGHVNLILADGAKLTATGGSYAGITVNEDDDYSLTIYGQQAQTGTLIAQGGEEGAGIGGEVGEANSPITINGGDITAIGAESGAGIGGGEGGIGQNITINGGVIHATGDNCAAGIGGGYGGWGLDITINGGVIHATGNNGAAGIGAGSGGSAKNITITGGTVTATGGASEERGGAGIGGGGEGYGENITITGGTVTATGGASDECGGAGIGGGGEGKGKKITINGGTVTATGGISNNGAAGIGGGGYSDGEEITINGGTITANGANAGGTAGAGIGGFNVLEININGGIITANGGSSEGADNGPAIGCSGGDASGIHVNPSLILKADNNNPPTTVIAPDRTADTDIASLLAGQRYATVEPSKAEPVCQIGTKGYESFAAAIAEVQAGETVQVLKDLQLDTVIVVTSSTPAFTLDLNGHILDGSNLKENDQSLLYNASTLSIIDSNPTATHDAPFDSINGAIMTGGKGWKSGNNYYYGGAIYNYNNGILNVNGVAFVNNTADYGGAVYSYDSPTTFKNCRFVGNTGTSTGSAMYIYKNVCSIDSCVFKNNSVQYGTIYNCETTSFTVNGSEFVNNTASSSGGGVWSYDAPTIVKNCRFDGNVGTAYGAALNISGNICTVDSCIFQNNYSYYGSIYSNNQAQVNVNGSEFINNNPNYGGGAFLYQCISNFKNCRFQGNTCHNYGATLYINGNTCSIDSCLFQDNVAYCGGLYGYNQATVNVTNSVFVGDSATWGGAAYMEKSASTFKNCRFNGNKSDRNGSAVYIDGNTCSIDSCIFEENTGKFGALYSNHQATVNVNGSDFIKNTAYWGGAIYVYQDTIAIKNCRFEGNSVTGDKSGGSAIVCGGGQSSLDSCVVKGNSTTNTTIYIDEQESLSIAHTTITDNHSSAYNGGIALWNASLTLGDGTVITNNTNNIYPSAGIYVWNDEGYNNSITLSGKVIIKDNTTNGEPANLCLSGIPACDTITINGLSEGSEIYVCTMINDTIAPCIFATNATEADVQYFVSDNGYDIVCKNNLLMTVQTTQITLAAEYGTYVSANTCTLPEGLEAYSCAEVNEQGVLQLVADSVLRENTPYILKGTAGTTYTCEVTAIGTYTEPVTVGLLTGVYADTTAPVGTYVLQNNSDVLGFYVVAAGQQPTVKANHCYLTLSKPSAKALYFDEETAINELNSNANSNSNGKFFENGKIVIVKNNKKFNTAGQRVK